MEQRDVLNQAIRQFIAAIEQEKLVPPESVEVDGKIHHFSSTGQKGDNKGWYVMHGGMRPSGAFGDFRQGVVVRGWKANLGRPLTAAEQRDVVAEQKTRKEKRKEKAAQEQDRARRLAEKILRYTVAAKSDHDYLLKKGVGANGAFLLDNLTATIEYSPNTKKPFLQLKTTDGKLKVGLGVEDDLKKKSAEEICKAWTSCLVTPMFDENGFQSVQLISKAGDKKFLYGAKKQGCYSVLGDMKGAKTVLMAEGFATAATLRETTGLPVVIAYDAGNLPHAAKVIRHMYPDVSVIVCADDDFMTTNAQGVKTNPGVTKGKQAAEEIGGDFVVPVFTIKDRPPKATDFNDMAALEGKQAVVDFFQNYFSERSKTMTQTIYNDEEGAVIVRPANSNADPAQVRTSSENRTTLGKIVDCGTAPYLNDEKNKPTYFISVDDGEKAKTLWGVDLGRALDKSGLGIGDEVAIHNKGKVRSEVYVDVFDQDGNFIRKEPRTIVKNAWEIEPFEGSVAERVIEKRIVEPPRTSYRASAYVPEPVASIKTHFDNEEFEAIQKIWKDVPRKTAYHTENGYHLVVDEIRKVIVARDRIELAKKPRHRLDQYYVAACEQARQLWGGQMEIHGDNDHRVKAWAYATVYGVEVTNFVPNDRERLDADKIMASLRKGMQPSFSRPTSPRGLSVGQLAPTT